MGFSFPAMAVHHWSSPDHLSLPSNPLFSSIVTLYLLILLYFPHLFLRLLLSPLLISTLILLLFLLRCGVSHQTGAETRTSTEPPPEPEPIEADSLCTETRSPLDPDTGPVPEAEQQDAEAECPSTQAGWEPEPEKLDIQEELYRCCATRPESGPVYEQKPFRGIYFADWDVGAPLEVIYEAYEREEDGDQDQNDALEDNCAVNIGRSYPSLSRYYPDSDPDSDSHTGSASSESSSWDGEFPGIQRWDEEEEEREGLIEIDLDHDHDDHGACHKGRTKLVELAQVDEEDNLIEIDVSPIAANYEFSW